MTSFDASFLKLARLARRDNAAAALDAPAQALEAGKVGYSHVYVSLQRRTGVVSYYGLS